MNSTPFLSYNRISKELNINLKIKHDDCFPFPGGGSKARKLTYILNDRIRKNYNAIVTTGSNQSNHLRATAIWAARLGWKLICVVHDKKPELYEGNLKITQLSGAELRFVSKSEVKVAMDKAMLDLINSGFKPFYIWGGGHCLEGSLAYYDAVKELKKQSSKIKPQYLFLASGTGTTQAGIEIGIRQFFPECKVIGVSVARNEEKGKSSILQSMEELNNFLNKPIIIPKDIIFDDTFVGEGYEKVYPELINTILWAAKKEGVILDSTYTGKAFHALKSYVKKGIIPPHSNVIFWHTGGLLNLMANKYI